MNLACLLTPIATPAGTWREPFRRATLAHSDPAPPPSVQPQAFAKEGLFIANIADADVFKAQGIDLLGEATSSLMALL